VRGVRGVGVGKIVTGLAALTALYTLHIYLDVQGVKLTPIARSVGAWLWS
jgi:hypothetical protein